MYQNKKQPNYKLWTILLVIFTFVVVIFGVIAIMNKNKEENNEPPSQQLPSSEKRDYSTNERTYKGNTENSKSLLILSNIYTNTPPTTNSKQY